MPNICLEYDVVTSTGIAESPAIAVGIMKPQDVTMADNGARGVDFLPGVTLACMTYAADSSLYNSPTPGAGMWFFDGTWQRPGVGETMNIPRATSGSS